MQDETNERRKSPVSRKFFQRIYWMPMSVFIVGFLSFAILIWMNRVHERERIDFELCDALMDMQKWTASAHLMLEEVISGDVSWDVVEISGEIDLAVRLAEALLNGGKNEHGLPLQPLEDSKLRKRIEAIKLLLMEFKRIGLQRVQDSKAANDSDLYERFHAIFKEIQEKAEDLEVVLEKNLIRIQAGGNRLFWTILLSWVFIVLGATIGFYGQETRRKAAENMLHKANEQLQSQTEELERHRAHLSELVEERTAELTRANLYLQKEILERKQAEESLRTSENKCRILVDYLPQKIYLKDQHSVYVYCNDEFAKDLNIKVDAIAGKTDYDLFPREIADKNIAEDKEVVKSGKPLDVEERQTKDGQEAVIHKFKMPARNEMSGVSGILGMLWDVTERVKLESVAEAVTLMNNIGYIFSGISHEIGNPINSAKMTLSVLKKRMDVYSKATINEYLDRTTEEISRVEYLLKMLKSFNMYETQKLQNVEMKPFMDKFLFLLADDFVKKGITIEMSFSSPVLRGYADPRALQQVMLNILSNACDAVNGRKTPRIVIEVSNVGGNIRIKATDNGCGMSEEQQKRLFTPFFTNKASGTGLGLVIAKKLVAGMNGTMEIKSRRDEGTSVEVSIQEGKDEH